MNTRALNPALAPLPRRTLDTQVSKTAHGSARDLAQLACGLCAVLCASLLLDGINRALGHALPPQQVAKNGVSLTLIALSSLLALGVYRRWFSARLLETLGLVYGVLVSLGIELSAQLSPWAPAAQVDYHLVRTISWVCLWIVVFPLVVRSSWMHTAIFAFASAISGPLALGISALYGNPLPEPSTIAFLALPNFGAALMALLLVRVLHRAGDSPLGPQAGHRVGPYVLERRLGHGGMGEVWSARHRLLRRRAAIKLLRPSLSADEKTQALFERRFSREARALAALRSPHVVAIHEHGRDTEGRIYYLQRLVAGHGPLPAARAIHLLKQLCDALEVTHAANLVHCDLKPSNIFISHTSPTPDTLKLLDFGLASPHDDDHTQPITATTLFGLTAAYAAPEMAGGERRVDPRADIYALGCVAHFALTGRPVFTGENALATLREHLHASPTPPSENAPHPVPPALDALVLRALAKDPAQRPGSARIFGRQLEKLHPRPRWTAADAHAWWRERA
ncbi:MAG: serine/threonine protein kinase [Deltaproteobacteria bacterium]|nr:serine/threonine protein kinase [Deltaproteobacteria bacterium]